MGLIYTLSRTAWTPTATADGSAMSANGYEGYVAGAAPDLARVLEVMQNGETTSSGVNVMALRRDSTAAATPTAKTPGKSNPSSQANVGTYFQTATTQPTNSNGTHVLNVSLNTYGGELRWVAGQGTSVEIYLVGGSTGNSEVSLGAVSGTPGQESSYMTVEEL